MNDWCVTLSVLMSRESAPWGDLQRRQNKVQNYVIIKGKSLKLSQTLHSIFFLLWTQAEANQLEYYGHIQHAERWNALNMSHMQPTVTWPTFVAVLAVGIYPFQKSKPLLHEGFMTFFSYTESTYAAAWTSTHIYANTIFMQGWIHTFALAQRHIHNACLTSV